MEYIYLIALCIIIAFIIVPDKPTLTPTVVPSQSPRTSLPSREPSTSKPSKSPQTSKPTTSPTIIPRIAIDFYASNNHSCTNYTNTSSIHIGECYSSPSGNIFDKSNYPITSFSCREGNLSYWSNQFCHGKQTKLREDNLCLSADGVDIHICCQFTYRDNHLILC